ncbi:glycerol-3-phosphate 1-O-acyltransferase PlsY [Candidatus Auribacterota bacterium]
MFGLIIALVLSYLIGSIPFGFIIARYYGGIDIREHGSMNIGATNVTRVLGKGPGNLTLILDVLKGFFAVMVLPFLFYNVGSDTSYKLFKILCAAAVICGHTWTIFLKFKGGKGVATGAGAFLGVAPLPLLCSAVVWFISAKISRYVSLSSILAASAFVVFAFIFGEPKEILIFCVLIWVVIVVRHRSNIKRLIECTENKIGEGGETKDEENPPNPPPMIS